MSLARATLRSGVFRAWALSALAAATLLLPRPAAARQVAGVEFADSIRVERATLRLNGVAVYKKFGVRVLAAGLWLEHAESEPAVILRTDAPRRYVTHFLHGVSSKRICKVWKEGLEANSPNAAPEVQRNFRDLCAWIRDFQTGDELAVTYVPGRGSLVEINGASVGSIPGKAFSDSYFALALGPKPGLGKNFKQRLLGG